MKRFLKKSLVSILIVMVLFNFWLASVQRVEAVNFWEGSFNVFAQNLKIFPVSIFIYALKALAWGIARTIHALMSGLAFLGGVRLSPLEAGDSDFLVTPFHIFFNKIELLDVNFFNFNYPDKTTMSEFRIAVAGWYYTMRTIAAMILAVILIYIGIRMALSTIASERAMYKKMLIDWLTSIALLFFLHYIMIFIMLINDALVNALASLSQGVAINDFIHNLTELVFYGTSSILESFAALGVYIMLVFQTFAFFLAYIRRMLTIGFLMIIAPLITITYSIDKIGDGKAQALNTWLKEFIYNILLQPFHCILYLAFANVAYKLLTESSGANLANAVFAVLCITYIKTGEELVRKIFGFEQASSLASMAVGTAMAMTAMNKAGDVSKKVGGGVAKLGRFVGKNKEFRDLKTKISKNREASKEASTAVKALKAKNKENGIVKSKEEYDEIKKQEKKNYKETGSVSEEAETAKKELSERIANVQGKKDGEQAEITGFKGFVNIAKYNAGQSKAGKFAKKGLKKVGQTFKSVEPTKVGKIASGLKKGLQPIGAVPVGLLRDTWKYLTEDGGMKKVVAATAGGVMGFGAFGAGDFASGVVGYKIGSSLVDGYNENSTKTLFKDFKDQAQLDANMTGEQAGEEQMYRIQANGDAGLYKDMNKKLDTLIKALKKLGVDDKAKAMKAFSTISMQILKDPSKVNQAFINNTIEDVLGNMEPENKEQAAGLLGAHAQFVTESYIYTKLKTLKEMGIDTETVGGIIGNFKNNSTLIKTMEPDLVSPTKKDTATETTETEEEHTETVDFTNTENITRIINEPYFAADALTSMSSGITKGDVEETNGKIEQLNSLLKHYEAQSEFKKGQIISAINNNNEVLRNFNNMIGAGKSEEISTADFNTKMSNYISKLKAIAKEADAKVDVDQTGE